MHNSSSVSRTLGCKPLCRCWWMGRQGGGAGGMCGIYLAAPTAIWGLAFFHHCPRYDLCPDLLHLYASRRQQDDSLCIWPVRRRHPSHCPYMWWIALTPAKNCPTLLLAGLLGVAHTYLSLRGFGCTINSTSHPEDSSTPKSAAWPD